MEIITLVIMAVVAIAAVFLWWTRGKGG